MLSATTTTFDQGTTFEEYKRVASVDTVVFVDPVSRLTRVHQRRDDLWFDTTFAQPHDVHLPSLAITLPEAEIFARD